MFGSEIEPPLAETPSCALVRKGKHVSDIRYID